MIEHGSQEWWEARKRLPTASRFGDMLGTGVTFHKYVMEKIAESNGVELPSYSNADMERGVELEPQAIEYYRLRTFSVIQPGQFFKASINGLEFGATPDALVNHDGILEVKCPRTTTHLLYIRNGKLPSDYQYQVQGELMASGRQWCDFISYDPRFKPLPMFKVRVYPDAELQAKIIKGLANFWEEFNKFKTFMK